MKQMTLEQFVQHVQASVALAQQEHILVTRDGDPVAVLVGIEHKDEEDWRLELSPEFWRMIEERRREPASVTLAEVEAELFAGKDVACRYSMLIQWSDEDKAYLVTLPEFGPYAKTHGANYEEAARHGREALESLIEAYLAEGRPLPEPTKYGSSVTVG
jgi:predicted RNase H-like HicB family nuclease